MIPLSASCLRASPADLNELSGGHGPRDPRTVDKLLEPTVTRS